MAMENPADLGQHPQRLSAVERFAREYGWWRVVAIPVMVVITVWVLVDVFRSPAQEAEVTAAGETSTSSATATPSLPKGPDPANASAIAAAKDGLPAGGAFTEQGDETYRDAGPSTMHAGKGGKQTIRFSVEIENVQLSRLSTPPWPTPAGGPPTETSNSSTSRPRTTRIRTSV